MKNELYFVFHFFYENEKRMRVLKIQSKTLLNMKMIDKYLNFVFHIEVKTKSNYKNLNLRINLVQKFKIVSLPEILYLDCFKYGKFDGGVYVLALDLLLQVLYKKNMWHFDVT